MPETPPDPETVARVKQDATARLLALPDVVAVGIGPKTVGGRATGEPAIRVFVRRKLPPDQVRPEELIPPAIDGVLTDVEVGGTPIPLAAAPVDHAGVIDPIDLPRDLTTYRPVVGGARIITVGSSQGGTLGCLLWDPDNHDVGYALTNMHVVKAPDISTVTKNTTKVGQPEGVDCSKKCCNDVIGVWVGGGDTAERDEALVKLSPGLKWQAKITEIGLVAGRHGLTQAEVTGEAYKVAKRGQKTRVTGGTISAMNATTTEADNLIIIAPVANPAAAAGQVTFFAFEGDSGSALVNSANEVVGLVWARDNAGNGYAYHIDHVLARLKNTDGLTVEVAFTADGDEVHTVPGAAFAAVPPEVTAQVAASPADRLAFTGADGRAPVGLPWFTDIPPRPATVGGVYADLAGSGPGRLLLDLWQVHRDELTRLIDRDRRVTLAWHRGGGAALTQLLLRLPADPDRTLPATLSGEPLMTSVDRLHAVFTVSASPALRADLDRARAVLPDLGGLSYPQIVAALAAEEMSVDA